MRGRPGNRFDRLRSLVDRSAPVTLVVGPAGSGKTVALEATVTGPGGARVAWVSAGEIADRTAVSPGGSGADAMALALAEAVVAAIGGLGGPTARPSGPDRASIEGATWPSTQAAAFRALAAPAALVLDGVDRLPPPAVEALGRFVALAADAGHHVLVGSRERLPWPVGRWRVESFARVVTARDLAFTPKEVQQTLGLDAADAVRVRERTEGWPVAVELVRLHLADHDLDHALDAAIEELLGYVDAEVLPSLHEEELLLLGRTSVLAVLRPELAAVVADRPEAEVLLREVARRTSLVWPTAAGFERSQVVREAIRRRHARLEPGTERQRHRAAARALLAGPDGHVGAMAHLVAARDWDEALAVLSERWQDLLAASRLDVVADTLDAMPPEVQVRDAAIALYGGAVHLVSGHPTRAERYLGAPVVVADPVASAAALILRSHATWWSTDPVSALALADRATAALDELEGGGPVPVLPGFDDLDGYRGMLDFGVARARALVGDLDESAARFSEIARRPALRPVPAMSAWGTLALVEALQGEVDGAEAAARASLAIAEEHAMVAHDRAAPAHLALALASQFAEGSERVWERIDQAATSAQATNAWGLLRMCRLAAACCGDPGFDVYGTLAPRARFDVRSFADRLVLLHLAGALARAGEADRAWARVPVGEPHELGVARWAEVALARDRAPSAGLLGAVQALAPPTSPRGRVLRLLAEAAVAPDRPHGVDRAAEAITLAEGAGLRGVLAEAPAGLWITLAAHRGADVRIADLAGVGTVAPVAGPVPTMSPRELEILALLDGPSLVNDIADDLFLSANTVKWHIGQIYRKLAVRSRATAVDRARQLDLI